MKMGLFTCDVAMRCTWGVFRWEFIFVDITCVRSSPFLFSITSDVMRILGFGSVVVEPRAFSHLGYRVDSNHDMHEYIES